MTSDADYLIEELPRWNNGAGIDAAGWITCMGNFDLAVGYSLIFWPRFTRFRHYVLREGFSEESLRGFERQTSGDRKAVEWVMNHIHMVDIHPNVDATEAQLRYLGRTLKQIYEVKLRSDFPDLRFEVDFNDEADIDPVDYQLSFWQVG